MLKKISGVFSLILILLEISISLKAQLPIASFSSPPTGCQNETLQIVNNSSNATTYSWDFCEGDLFKTPSTLGVANTSAAFSTRDAEIVIDSNNQWFGFITSRGTNAIYRIEFGADLGNTSPTVTNLGNINSLLSGPENIKLVNESGNWYGLVVNTSNSKLIRLSFGSDLKNTPTAEVILSGIGTFNSGADIGETPLSKVLVLTNSTTNQITVVNFGTAFSNYPAPSDIITSATVGGAVGLEGIDVFQWNGNWMGLTVASNSRTFYYLNFGSNLFSAPTVSPITTPAFATAERPADVQLAQDMGSFVAFIQMLNGTIYRCDFGSLISNTSPSFTNLGNLGSLSNTANFELIKTGSRWYGFTLDAVNTELFQIPFPEACSSNISYSSSYNNAIYYAASGTYYVSLTAYDQSNNSSYYSQSINILNLNAPDINFSSQNNCVNNNVNFTPINQSGGISSYQWAFDDGGTSSVPNPSYSYSSVSIYYPSLTVTASNGCQNFVQDTLQIFNAPQANFSLPVASPLCSNQNYLFTNTSTSDVGSNPTWQWSVNGSNVSTSQNLTYLFTSSVSQSVTLTAAISGCSMQSTQNITTLVDGPLISFNSSSIGCMGSSILFTNTTTDPVSSFSWTFGDGNSSSQTNESNTYSTAGNYVVNLSGINSNGCQNSFSKNITIYSLPQPNFAIEAPPLSCEKSPSQFDNLTPSLVDSNISSWKWKFGDAVNGASTVKNPAYTYASANNYMVSLRATTNVGCKDSIQKLITILPSPQAGFANSAACINQSTHFTDASSGSISTYNWHIQNTDLPGPTPSYVFKSSGSFPVKLTVTASNGCLNQITKNVVVPVMPVVDFSVQAPCTGHPTIFQEINSKGVDPAVAWNWDFGTSSATGSPVNYQFPSEGGYSVTMNTTRQSGCVYSTQKNISISTGPIANFTPSLIAGAAPLVVSFNNTSTADSYLWQFGDATSTTSTETSPEFVYTQLGNYKVLLTAFNMIGCSDTLSTEIDVVIPRIDIIMNNLSLTNDPNTNSSKAVVTILNSGNVPLVDPDVLIDFGGNASVKEKISGMLRPGKSIVQTLGLQIVPRSLEYICAEINVDKDVDIHNNKQCVPLSSEDVVLAPYPNPSTAGQFTLEWVGAAQEDVVITIFKSSGSIAFEQHLDESSAGLGQLTVNTTSFGNGLYLIQFAGSKTKKTFRIMIAN